MGSGVGVSGIQSPGPDWSKPASLAGRLVGKEVPCASAPARTSLSQFGDFEGHSAALVEVFEAT